MLPWVHKAGQHKEFIPNSLVLHFPNKHLMAGPCSLSGSMGTAGTSPLVLLLFVSCWCWENFAGVIQGKISFSNKYLRPKVLPWSHHLSCSLHPWPCFPHPLGSADSEDTAVFPPSFPCAPLGLHLHPPSDLGTSLSSPVPYLLAVTSCCPLCLGLGDVFLLWGS